jgi:hypothetical protein
MAEKYIFMCIATKAHKPKSPDSNTRIYVMEIPSGRLYDGLLPTETVKKLQLRDIIPCDLSSMKPVNDCREVFEHNYFDVQPEALFLEFDIKWLR